MKTEHFKLHEIVPGVWTAEADIMGASVGNAAIIDAGGKTIIVDTFMTDVAAVELRAAAEKLTGNQVYMAVNSHWHDDHTGGNQVFADVPIVSTTTTLERVIENTSRDLTAWQAEIDDSLRRLEEAADRGNATAAHQLIGMRHYRNFADNFKLTLPNLINDGRLVVEGERRIEIETRGRGHTVSDTFVWIPSERVMITGDLCWNRIHPRMHDGFPGDWASYVAELLAMDPLYVVPGHGAPGDASALSDLPDYFRAVEALLREVRTGTDPKTLDAPEVSKDWAGLARFHDGLRVLAEY